MKYKFSSVLGGKQPVTRTSPSLFKLCDNTPERKRENEKGATTLLTAWPDRFLLLHKPLTARRCLSHKFLKALCKLHCICSRKEGAQHLEWFSLFVYLVFSFKVCPDLSIIDWMTPLLTRGLQSSLCVVLGIKSKHWKQVTPQTMSQRY